MTATETETEHRVPLGVRCGCFVWGKHMPRCLRPVTRRCRECGDYLCGTCARQHHAHDDIEKLT